MLSRGSRIAFAEFQPTHDVEPEQPEIARLSTEFILAAMPQRCG